MANTCNSSNSKQQCRGFLSVVFSWSLSDVLNEHLYKFQVEEVPLTFSSTTHYMNSFIYPLLEETRADLSSCLAGISQAPASTISGLQRVVTIEDDESKIVPLYQITLNGMSYDPMVGDLIVLTQVKPKCIDDLASSNNLFLTAYVTKKITKSKFQNPKDVEVLLSHPIESDTFKLKEIATGFVVYLTNLTTNMRIWQALTMSANMNVIQTTLSFSSSDAIGHDTRCTHEEKGDIIDLNLRQSFDSFKLDTSQESAVISCLAAKKIGHKKACVKLIWGPPGTGKTKTVASLLFVLLRKNQRTLTCAPTNIAVIGVAKRLLCLIKDNDLGCDTYGLGDIVLFGNKERMKIKIDHEELLDVFLDNRLAVLGNCLWRWKTCLKDMINFLENPVKEHQCFLVPKKPIAKILKNNANEQKPDEIHEEKQLTFEEFVIKRFDVLGDSLIDCIKNLYTHLPTCVIPLEFVKKMKHSIDLIQKIGECVNEIVTTNQCLNKAFDTSFNSCHFMKLRSCKTECLQALNDLKASSYIPKAMKKFKLKKFCLQNAWLIFCTASSSIKLFTKGMTPIELVLIDEAAQLKECESLIPLQLPGVTNAVLVGDERQLPAMVQSKICEEAKFGRSLFERLVLIGHQKHLLNVQYRMHPSISQFPNSEFYNGQILDGFNVTDKAHEKRFLQADMYGSYSFINVDYGKEELDNNHSTKNMVEVAVIAQIIANLFKESVSKKQTVSVGCISPYKAQVDEIQAKLGTKYNRKKANGWSFDVNVRSVDGFQGGEEDVIIFSTVRCNQRGSIGFLSSCERANVALTRARHCLWIVGSKETMIKSGSVWSGLVYDAETRGCVFDAHEDKSLAQVMVDVMVELADFGSLLKNESILFKEAKWKVNFTNMFLERMANIGNLNVRKLVVSLLVKLSSGWRQTKKNKLEDLFEIYNVDGHVYLVWSVDIVYENSLCVQVLKFWDILLLSQAQQRVKHLKSAFDNYTCDMISRCQIKRLKRNLVFPMTWPVDSDDDSTLVLTSQFAKLSLNKQTGSKTDKWIPVTR